MKRVADNYYALALAILRQAMVDYRRSTMAILKSTKVIEELKTKSNLTPEERKKYTHARSTKARAERDKTLSLHFWEKAHLDLYSELDYQVIRNRFDEVEAKAIDDFNKGIIRVGKYEL